MSDTPDSVAAEAVMEVPVDAEVIQAVEPVEGEQQQVAAAETQAEAVKSAMRKFKLKVDGEEFEEEFDPTNEAELIKQLQLQKVAQKRMQSEAMTKRQAKAMIDSFKSNPEKIMRDLGMDPQQFAEEFMYKIIEEQTLTPEQKEVREAKRIIEAHKAQQEEQVKSRSQQEEAALESKYAEEYQKTILEALEASGLPKGQRSMARIAKAMSQGLSKSTTFDPKVLAKIARQEWEEDLQSLLESYGDDDDKLLAFMGKNTDKIRKADMKRLKAKEPKPFSNQKPPVKSEAKPAKELTREQWRKMMDEKFKD